MIIQPIVNIAEICTQQGITQAVICPGSRSAVLTLAFARHPKISTFVIPDERSAAFIALGLAQSSDKPVVLVCTSGTAAANFYPAIIEAYYQQVPLIVLTADRPPEWIDQHDGQTIRQLHIFQNHVRGAFQFPVSTENKDAIWHAERMVSEAFICATAKTRGPVHINIPIREPFYPTPSETFHYDQSLKIIKIQKINNEMSVQQASLLVDELQGFGKVILLVGQHALSDELTELLTSIQKHHKWVILGDIFSNIHGVANAVAHQDTILSDPNTSASLKPDLLISIGKSVLSKQLKTFFKSNPPAQHWHIGENEEVVDTFQSLTRKWLMRPEQFFMMINDALPGDLNKTQNGFFNLWKEKELQASAFIETHIASTQLSEFHAIKLILERLPEASSLHLANSMPVRYANYFGLNTNSNINVWANRGTSGIDGCTSTSIGHAINSDHIHTLITGDTAFFYDRNALWHNHLPSNIRIILLNNHGGGIFRLINGPKQLDELETYFENNQKLKAANTARDFGMNYYTIKNLDALPQMLEKFFDPKSGASILEIETEPQVNQKIFEVFIQKTRLMWR